MIGEFYPSVPPVSRMSSLRQRILRGRIILDDTEEIFYDTTKDEDEEKCFPEEDDKSNRREVLLSKRALMRKKQKKEREKRPDFNIVTDIPPDPDFDFSASSFCVSSFSSCVSNSDVRKSTLPEMTDGNRVLGRQSFNDESRSSSVCINKYNDEAGELAAASLTRKIKEVSHSILVDGELRQNSSHNKTLCETLNDMERSSGGEERVVFENSKSVLNVYSESDEEVQNAVTSFHQENLEDLTFTVMQETRKRDLVKCAEIGAPLDTEVPIDANDSKLSCQQDNSVLSGDGTVIMHSVSESSAEPEIVGMSAFETHLNNTSSVVKMSGLLYNKSAKVSPLKSIVSVNGSPGLSAIAYDYPEAEKSLPLTDEAQDYSLNKTTVNTTRDRLLNVLNIGKNVNFRKSASRTLLSFKTPQRSARIGGNRQNNINVDNITVNSKVITRMTSTPVSSPDSRHVCGRYEDHHRKFCAPKEASNCRNSLRGSIFDGAAVDGINQDDMIVLSPNTRILKSKFKKASEPPGSPFRPPQMLRPSRALQSITNYDSPGISSLLFDNSTSLKQQPQVNAPTDQFSRACDSESSNKENVITFKGERLHTANDTMCLTQESTNLINEDAMERLEKSAQSLSLVDTDEEPVTGVGHSTNITAKTSINVDICKTHSPGRLICRTPKRRDESDLASASGLDISIITVGTPGLESYSTGRPDPCSNVSSLSSPFMDDSSASHCSCDSAVSVLPEEIKSEAPFHLISHYKKVMTPEMILAKRRIVHPEEPVGGLRRSHRNRIKPVRRWLGEEPVYRKDSQGNLELVDVTSVRISDPLLRRHKSATMAGLVEMQLQKQRRAKLRRHIRGKWS